MRVPPSTVLQTTAPLADLAPELLGSVDVRDPTVPRALKVTTLHVSRGTWQPPAASRDRLLALVLIDGAVFRSVTVGGFSTGDVLGAGDVVVPHSPDATSSRDARADVGWNVLQPTTMAVIDGRLAAWAAQSPGFRLRLLDRQADQLDRVMARLALVHRRRLEERLVLVLWELADRWGRVTSDGVLLPITLRHHQLAALVAALRPPVTLALRRLSVQGVVERSLRGYLLRGSPEDAWASVAGAQAPPWPGVADASGQPLG